MSVSESKGPSPSRDELVKEFQSLWVDGRAPSPEAYCEPYRKREDYEELRDAIVAFDTMTTVLPRKRRAVDDVGGQTLGDYRIEREIGRGGMGVVYEATQVSLQRRVALKVLPAHLTLRKSSVERFRREAQTASRLEHPSIVEIYAVGEWQGTHYFAMERIEGRSLDQIISEMKETQSAHSLCEAEGGLGSREHVSSACRRALEVANALEFAHQRGVLHRDVKPSNILIPKGRDVVLTDFGLAREEGWPALSATGEFIGTAHYVSPEQAHAGSEPVGPQSDVYSLGVTLFELLTLERPFEGATTASILHQILSSDPPSLEGRLARFPRDLATICLTAMERDRARRYPSMASFAQDLRSFLEYRPIQARPLNAMTKFWRVVQRHPVPAALSLIVLLGLIIGPTLLALQQRSANQSIRQALEEAKRERENAEVARLEAEYEAETAKRISNFLTHIFHRPEGRVGDRDVSALEVLKEAAASIEIDLKGSPEIQARLMNTVGTVFCTLGMYEEAEIQLDKSVRLQASLTGEEDLTTLVFVQDVATLHRLRGDSAKARPIQERVLARRTELLGREHPHTVEAINNMACVHRELGRYELALGMFSEALEFMKDFEETKPQQELSLLSNLMNLLSEMNRLEEAQDIGETLISRLDAFYGSMHRETLSGQNVLALLYSKLGRIDDAEALLLEALDGFRDVLGEDHPETMAAANNLAILYASEDCPDEAEAVYQECLETLVDKLGEDHPYVFNVVNNLGVLYAEERRIEEAEIMFMRALEGRRRVLGEEHPHTQLTLENFAAFYVNEGRHRDARALYE